MVLETLPRNGNGAITHAWCASSTVSIVEYNAKRQIDASAFVIVFVRKNTLTMQGKCENNDAPYLIEAILPRSRNTKLG
jgi:hypothetical protein